MHFEPSALAAAEGGEAAAYWQRDLANSGLHEAAHALRYTHTEPVPSPWGPQYAEEPFKYLSPGENSCIDWS
jgi:hypothetical protein